MRHYTYTIASIILLAAMLTCVSSAGATDWHVNSGESIQNAIDDAADGDTVIVRDGIYTEQLYITKSLDLREGRNRNNIRESVSTSNQTGCPKSPKNENF